MCAHNSRENYLLAHTVYESSSYGIQVRHIALLVGHKRLHHEGVMPLFCFSLHFQAFLVFQFVHAFNPFLPLRYGGRELDDRGAARGTAGPPPVAPRCGPRVWAVQGRSGPFRSWSGIDDSPTSGKGRGRIASSVSDGAHFDRPEVDGALQLRTSMLYGRDRPIDGSCWPASEPECVTPLHLEAGRGAGRIDSDRVGLLWENLSPLLLEQLRRLGGSLRGGRGCGRGVLCREKGRENKVVGVKVIRDTQPSTGINNVPVGARDRKRERANRALNPRHHDAVHGAGGGSPGDAGRAARPCAEAVAAACCVSRQPENEKQRLMILEPEGQPRANRSDTNRPSGCVPSFAYRSKPRSNKLDSHNTWMVCRGLRRITTTPRSSRPSRRRCTTATDIRSRRAP